MSACGTTHLFARGGAAKVADHPAALCVFQHILRFNVPVCHWWLLAVHVAHGIAHLREDLCRVKQAQF